MLMISYLTNLVIVIIYSNIYPNLLEIKHTTDQKDLPYGDLYLITFWLQFTNCTFVFSNPEVYSKQHYKIKFVSDFR